MLHDPVDLLPCGEGAPVDEGTGIQGAVGSCKEEGLDVLITDPVLLRDPVKNGGDDLADPGDVRRRWSLALWRGL